MSLPVTGVGSLPHVDRGAAAAFVAGTTDVPYLPQLPNRHPEERMLVQWGDGLCGCGAAPGAVGLAYGEPTGPRHEAFAGAEAVLASLPAAVPRLKTQATGPVTLSLGMLAAGHPGKGLYDCVLDGLRRRVEEHLVRIEHHLPDVEVVLVFDEPALTGLGVPGFPVSPAEADHLLRAVLAAAPAPAGVHCCGPTDWALLAGLRPRWISWDVSALGAHFAEHAEAVAAATADGTSFIWGIVPTDPGPAPGDLAERFHRVLGELLVAGADPARLTGEALLSPACGLAGLSERNAEGVADRVRALAGELATHG